MIESYLKIITNFNHIARIFEKKIILYNNKIDYQ